MTEKFEAGKKYRRIDTTNDDVYECLFSSEWLAVLRNTNTGSEFSLYHTLTKWYEEYHEPVITEKWVNVYEKEMGIIRDSLEFATSVRGSSYAGTLKLTFVDGKLDKVELIKE